MKIIKLVIILSFILGCSTYTKHYSVLESSNVDFKRSVNLFNWQHKDIQLDSIPGISSNRAYQELLKKGKEGKEIIIAVIDTQIDINHEEYTNQIWQNKNEIPNNKIDDDHNGYIDDVNGWNFLGNKNGESTVWVNAIFTRIVKKYDTLFKNKKSSQIKNTKKKDFLKYKKAKQRLEKERKEVMKKTEFINKKYEVYKGILQDLQPYFPDKKYTKARLDSIQTKDDQILTSIKKMKYCIDKSLDSSWFETRIRWSKEDTDYYINTKYNDRSIIGDNVEDINDAYYGYHNININHERIIYHGTYVTGLIASNRYNNKGIKGVAPSNTKIMPVVVACEGDEYDKDIALAIRYAVNNGANIINMSFKKDFEMHNEWVVDAIKYAKKHNVLLVKAAGNDNQNLDLFKKNGDYPNDYDSLGNEYVTNFLNIGASSHHLNKRLKANFSNYSKKNVDIFAPGDEIYTTSPLNKYRFKSGTSLSTPIVSGVAALIWSYYPKLKAHEVKEIIMESGISYDIEVEIRNEKGEKVLVPFRSLSKSGKIVNAYNALLMAKNYKKWKKGKWPKK